MIKNAKFVSVWDNGYELISNCKANTETHEVFDIEMFEGAVDDDGFELEILDREYIIIDNEEFCVGSAYTETENWNEETDYWYK